MAAEDLAVVAPAPREAPAVEALPARSTSRDDPRRRLLPTSLAVRLAAVATRAEVLDVVAEEVVSSLGAEMVNISVVDDDDPSRLRLIRTRDTPAAVAACFATYPAYGPYPSADALRTGKPVLLRSLAERDARYPALAAVPVDATAFAVLPIRLGDRALGVLGLGWREPQRFTARQIALLETVAQLCAS